MTPRSNMAVLSKRSPRLLLFILLAMLAGCVSTPQTDALLAQPAELKRSVELEQVPFFPQERFQCGPAALATVLGDAGVMISPDQLVDDVYVPRREGSFQVEMLAAARKWQRIPYQIDPQMSALIAELEAKKPVLVLQNLGLDWYQKWHYAVVVGVDWREQELVLRSGTDERRLTELNTFEATWARSDYWGVVLLRPGEIPANADPTRYFLSVADFSHNGASVAVTEAYRAGAERWPDSVLFPMGLGNQFLAEERYLEARDQYLQVIELQETHAPAHNNLAEALYQLGDSAAALRHAERAVALGGRFVEHYRDTLNKIRQAETGTLFKP